MVRIEAIYRGGLRCEATHVPSGTTLVTDAPIDNHGRGESFSPTDLVATALGTCMLTVMGIVAKRHGIPLEGARVTVDKKMALDPERRIGRLAVEIRLPIALEPHQRGLLERAALSCPVHRSLGSGVEIPVEFVYPDDPS